MQPTVRRPAPARGEHTDAVLAELGYSENEIAILRSRKIVL
jgi:crotonobetainyl-CoA:carnitine CoA-transferase CaiB-like acyl-CoA transferase